MMNQMNNTYHIWEFATAVCLGYLQQYLDSRRGTRLIEPFVMNDLKEKSCMLSELFKLHHS
jgi:hypothetical protein